MREKAAEDTRIMKDWIILRGGGDLATGAVQCLWRAGFKPLILEAPEPLAIRREVALSEAVYEGLWEVEDLTAEYCPAALSAIEDVFSRGRIPIITDPEAAILQDVSPEILVDAIIAKKNLGTAIRMGRLGTIALGPGFCAGKDVDIVIETMRGHNLGRLIFEGEAAPNTGTPGIIQGKSAERVIHAPCSGILRAVRKIGDVVEKGESIAEIDGTPVPASLDGVLRGLIRPGLRVEKGLKIADIDPRISERKNCFTISDKSRALGGAVLEAVMILSPR